LNERFLSLEHLFDSQQPSEIKTHENWSIWRDNDLFFWLGSSGIFVHDSRELKGDHEVAASQEQSACSRKF
jgi:hypothetical protein